jgi:hypothetical protein
MPDVATGETDMNYGLENSANWGWDWFPSFNEALEAKNCRPKLYGHNGSPWVLTTAEILENDL